MKKFLCIGFLTLFFGLFIMPTNEAKAYDYTIDSYHVDMKVTKQNTYQISETIQVNFLQHRHGIYRDIPLLNEIAREDGSKSQVMAKVEHVSCSDEYEISRENDNCRLKIGDEDETIIGPKKYTISYDYVMGNDVLQGNDELYFNIIGTGWTTSIRNVSFSIEMPKEFDEQKLGMSYGSYGQANLDGLWYWVEENTIKGQLDSNITLHSGEGLTVRLLLDEGYFDKTTTIPLLAYISICIAVIGAVLAFVFWWLFGRDDPVVETVEFYPPDGLNSLELAFAYKGTTDNNDVVSLLVYLAQKGYVQIEENEKKDFVIRKVREYDGFNKAEAAFFQGLFSSGDTVTKSSLQNCFYKTVERVRGIVDNTANKKKIFYANSINKGWILWLTTILSFVFALFKPIYDYEFSAVFALGAGVGFSVFLCLFYMILFDPNKKIWQRIVIFILMLIIEFVVFLVICLQALLYSSPLYMIATVIAFLLAAVSMFFCAYMSKRTEYGTEILGRIRGFRNFLETAEVDRLEAMVNENPQYFYEILPYTYVLDLSNTWMKKFESIAIEPPQWYYGYNHTTFDIIMFHHFMNTTMTQATSSMTSRPSSSGGGFSGGGSGGGGGGSW